MEKMNTRGLALRGIIAILAILAGAAAPGGALADRGAIVSIGKVQVFEPGQKAIIAYDGFEEMIILSTDLSATAAAHVIEFMPLPSKPEVALADAKTFRRLDAIVRAHNLEFVIMYKGRAGGPLESARVSLIMHQRLGPHDISVVKTDDLGAFIKWMKKFFDKKGFDPWTPSEKERYVIGDYIDKGYRYFAFDVLEIGAAPRTIEPLVYTFKTDKLYYPMTISTLFAGGTQIDLYLITNTGRYAQRIDARFLKSTSARISADEMKKVHPEIASLMGRNAILQAFRYQGSVEFMKDIEIPSNISIIQTSDGW